jgi:5S rRNA maturation endonuclease (ribonuclease M5)
MTPAQAGFWTRLRRYDPSIPERFTPGDYRCPAHDDQRASLSVDYKGNRVLWHCQAGCSAEAVRKRLGVAWVDVDDYGPAIGKRPTAAYTYHDAAGAPVLRVQRFEPKDFRVQRFEDGQWLWGRGKAPYLLYRLPRVLEAIKTGERVWLVEGEKDADALERAGAVATTTPGGAGKSWRPEYTEALRGAYVTIVADRDDAGRKHARKAFAALQDDAAEVVLVEPAVNQPHADASDHLAAGFGLDDFARLDPGEQPAGGADEELPEVAREDGAAILDEVERQYRAYIAWANDHQAVAVTLWTAHTHAAEVSDTTPYLAIESAEPESGKTRTLEVAEHLAARAWMLVEPSEAAMFRKIERDRPTILLDESDALWGAKADGREGLRALLNAGYRRGATVPRCVGEGNGMTVQDFPVYGPKALAGLAGRLPRTIASRSIPIRLQRRAKGERVERFRARRAAAELDPLRLRLAAWVKLVAPELAAAVPEIPEALSDRQADCWEPLLALADAAGDVWAKRAREAAIALHEHDPTADPGTGTLLLAHIRDAFTVRDDTERITGHRDELATVALLRTLVNRDDGPWAAWWGNDVEADRTKGPASRLAGLLRPYGVAPKQLKIGGEKVRGYEWSAFADVWERYLGPGTNSPDGTSVQPRSEAKSDPDGEDANLASEQGSTKVPFQNSVPGPSGARRVRCPACGTTAELDPTTSYGQLRLEEGHSECGAAWDPTP